LQSPKILNFNLSKNIRRAKREGFYEIYGDISINYGEHNLFVSCREDKHDVGSAPFGIDIKIQSRNYPKKIVNFNITSILIPQLNYLLFIFYYPYIIQELVYC
jgi:hypothetical protein